MSGCGFPPHDRSQRCPIQNPIPVKALVAMSLVAAVAAEASTINWASSLNRTNVTSTGGIMDGTFRFELGVFKGGFVPTRENTDQWLANWVPAQRTAYNANTRWFTTNHVVTTNVSPFTVGAKGYVWGFGEGGTGGEWILFRATNWTWPAPNPESPVVTSWTAKSANSVIVGDVQNTGAYHMRTDAVNNAPAPAVTWDEWRSAELAAAASPNGAPADLNANGVQDVLDYALQRGVNPNPGSWMRWHNADGKRHLEIRIPRRRDRPATFVVEVSTDLKIWMSGPAVTDVVGGQCRGARGPGQSARRRGGQLAASMRVRAVVGS